MICRCIHNFSDNQWFLSQDPEELRNELEREYRYWEDMSPGSPYPGPMLEPERSPGREYEYPFHHGPPVE